MHLSTIASRLLNNYSILHKINNRPHRRSDLQIFDELIDIFKTTDSVRLDELVGLEEKGLNDNPHLIPNLSDRQYTGNLDKIYSSNAFRKLKRMVEEESGIKFELRTLSRSNGQHLIDAGIPLEYVSKNLGHSTTKTTEIYYARVKSESTYDLINGAWENRSSVKTRKFKINR